MGVNISLVLVILCEVVKVLTAVASKVNVTLNYVIIEACDDFLKVTTYVSNQIYIIGYCCDYTNKH